MLHTHGMKFTCMRTHTPHTYKHKIHANDENIYTDERTNYLQTKENIHAYEI